MVVTKITVKSHLAEYMIAKYWDQEADAIRLPDTDDLYITIYNLTTKRPANAPIDDGNLCIVLPCRRDGKNPEYYNYIGRRGARHLEKKIEIRFWAEVNENLYEQKHRYGIDYIVSIEAFMLRYNITGISDEAIRKNYYRWKNQLRPKTETRGYKKKQRQSVSNCHATRNAKE